MDKKDTTSSNSLIFGIVIVVAVILIGVFLFRNNQTGQDKDQNLDKVRLQLKWIKQAQFMGYLVADEMGYYKDEGIDIEIKPGGVGINPVDVLISGDADIAVAWTGNVLPAITKGENLVNFAQGLQKSALRLMAKKESKIKKPADIKGKKIGTWPGGNEIEPYAFIGAQGLDKDRDVELISQGFDMNQLLNDEIDLASAMIYNEYWLPIEEGYKESDFIVFDLEEEGVGMLQDALFVDQEYLDNNKDLLVRFLRATMKGWDYAITHLDEAVDMMGVDFTENDVTARDHQLLMAREIAKLFVADDATKRGLFYISKDKLQQTVDIATEFVEEVSGIDNLDDIYTMDIWNEAVKDIDFSNYSNI